MQRRLDRVFNPSKVPQEKKVKGNAAQAYADPPVWNEQREMRQTAALDTLLSNKYANQFPLPQSIRQPASNPSHYDDLITELQEAPNRSWFGNLVNRIKGGIRLS
jgi:cytochrome b pre-mRNA-processing protein 6